tara:strand:- start:333 stop:521 length:189 start_codon:yes stop_codon:yes gene_type:complete
MNRLNLKDLKISIIGLGYVGLPLTLEFAKYRSVIGYDINAKRVNDLKKESNINLDFSRKVIK